MTRIHSVLLASAALLLVCSSAGCRLTGNIGDDGEDGDEGEGEGEGDCSSTDFTCVAFEDCGLGSDATIADLDDEKLECIFEIICPEDGSPELQCGNDLDSPGFSYDGCVAARSQLGVSGIQGCPDAPAEDFLRFAESFFRAEACGDLAVANGFLNDYTDACFEHARLDLSCDTTGYVGDVDAQARDCSVILTGCDDGVDYLLDCSQDTRDAFGGCICSYIDGGSRFGVWDPFEIDDGGENFCADATLIPEMAAEKCRWFLQ